MPHAGNLEGGAVEDGTSAWVRRFAALIKPGGRVLDLACGSGRHSRYLAARGHAVVAVDRDIAALELLSPSRSSLGTGHSGTGQSAAGPIETLQCDLESSPWPFPAASFDAVVVINYLFRPLFKPIMAVVRPGGVLIYETFAEGHERHGRPRNPAFLLRRNELLEMIPRNWTVLAFEQGLEAAPQPAVRQRICAVQTMVWPTLMRAVEHAG